MANPLRIDGSVGEGGGQILRTSLALSCLQGAPIELVSIRAGRRKPGLLHQHLCAVRAAAAISGAEVEGDELGSRDLSFRPGAVAGGEHHFAVGSAGSATLVLQTVLPPLLFAAGPSRVVVEGGTHIEQAPPFEFLAHAFLPLAPLSAEVRPPFHFASPIYLNRGIVRPSRSIVSANISAERTHNPPSPYSAR